MKIRFEVDGEDVAVVAEGSWGCYSGEIDLGVAQTRLIALRRAERTLERALARVKKLREKEEAK